MKLGANVATIEETKDVAIIKLDELMSSLQTCAINQNAQTMNKGNVLEIEVNSLDNAPYTDEEIMALTQNFANFFETSSRNQNFIRSLSRNQMNDNMQRTERYIIIPVYLQQMFQRICMRLLHPSSNCTAEQEKLERKQNEDQRFSIIEPRYIIIPVYYTKINK